MQVDAKHALKDATALGVFATSGGLFLLRACREEDALWRAGQNALTGALLAAPLAAAAGFIGAKVSKDEGDPEAALEYTAVFTVVAGVAVGALSGLASLARDAFCA